jgi:hypothetical protein
LCSCAKKHKNFLGQLSSSGLAGKCIDEVNMNRRTFIRIVGGGVIFSATAGLTACSHEMQPEAIAAWQGPKQETDERKWILSYAILAPHSHNLQSWLVDLRTPNILGSSILFYIYHQKRVGQCN